MKVLTNNQYYSQIANVIREQNGTNNTYTPPQMVSALKDLFYEEVEGVPPINFQGIGENLLDYRIDGASGGVGERTSNLFTNVWFQGVINASTGIIETSSIFVCSDFIPITPLITYSCSRTVSREYNNLRCYDANKQYVGTGGTNANIGNPLNNGDSFGTFMITNESVAYIRFNDKSNDLTTKYMLVEGEYTASTMPDYEPYGYKVPVVMNGKNLLSKLPDSRIDKGIEYTNVNNLYLHIEGTSNTVYSQTTSVSLLFKKGKYYINFYCDEQYKSKLFVLLRNNNNIDIVNVHSSGASFELNNDETIKLIAGVKENNTTINTNMYIQIVSGITSQSTYEPYIEPTTTNIYLDKPIEANANIPSEYTEVEYLESTGTQYIDTNYTPVQGDDLEFKNVTINTFNGALFSAGIESYQLILLGLGSVCYYKYFQTGNAVASSFSTITNGNIKVLNGNLYINNVLKAEADYGGAVDTTLNIFRRANNTSNLIGKIGEIIISNNGIIKRDFIPCYRKSDNVAGLYDLVNNTFYTNQGTGNFIVGPIKENESISLSDTNVSIPTIRGTNTLSIDTTVQPSNVYVKSRHESSHEAQIRQLYESVNAELTQYKAQYGELGGE